MQKNYFNFNALEGEYPAFETEIRRGTPTAAFGVSDSLKYLLSSLLPFPVLYITADGISAQKAAENARSLSGKDTAVLAAKDEVLFYRKALSKDSLYKRLNGIYALQNGCPFVATEIDALLQIFPKKLKLNLKDLLKPKRSPFATATTKTSSPKRENWMTALFCILPLTSTKIRRTQPLNLMNRSPAIVYILKKAE